MLKVMLRYEGHTWEEMSELGFAASWCCRFYRWGKSDRASDGYEAAFIYATVFNSIILQHPEVSDLVSDGVMSDGLTATRLGLSGIPPVAEVIMIERDLRLVEATGRYHVSRVTTRAGIDVIRKAKQSGLPVTCDMPLTILLLMRTRS